MERLSSTSAKRQGCFHRCENLVRVSWCLALIQSMVPIQWGVGEREENLVLGQRV